MKPGRRQNALDRFSMRTYTRFDVAVFKRFGRSPMARFMGVQVLMLRTIGRRTGRVRENLVAYIEDGESLLVGGGNWGWDNNPGWLYNIASNPVLEVTIGRETRRMRGTVLEGDDEEKAARRLADAYPHSQVYVSRRVRPVPAVRLTPLE